jgi:hypothetical protein
MRLLRSQGRYLGFRQLRNRLFRLRRRRLRFLWLLRTRVPGPHVTYVVDGIPPKLSVESPGHRGWPQSGKDSTGVGGNRYVRFVSRRLERRGPRERDTAHAWPTAARCASTPPNEPLLKRRQARQNHTKQ